MKVSVWQQFSSNHSANFEVVGKFESVEQAQQSELKIRDIIQQIGDYYRNHYNEQEFDAALERGDLHNLSPVEQAIKDEYKADEWLQGLDWTFDDRPDGTV